MTVNIEDIYPLTDFKQHSGKYQELLRNKKSPVVLTVNGKAVFVLQDAMTYQHTVKQIEALEAELRQLREQNFRDAVMVGVRELEAGQRSIKSHDEIFEAALTDHGDA
jgi:prevent-host-death family protein